MWGLNARPQDQKLHAVPTEPARHPGCISFHLLHDKSPETWWFKKHMVYMSQESMHSLTGFCAQCLTNLKAKC